MAGHITPIALRIGQAIEAGSGLRAAVEEAYAELGAMDEDVYVDYKANYVLVLRKGYSPLADPGSFVFLAREVK